MRSVEIGLGVLLTLGGLRSLWVWSRRRFEGTDMKDHLLYALYVTGRIGLWFAFAGFFFIYASTDARGRALADELQPYRWYLAVPLILASMQLLGGYFLGRRSPDAPADPG